MNDPCAAVSPIPWTRYLIYETEKYATGVLCYSFVCIYIMVLAFFYFPTQQVVQRLFLPDNYYILQNYSERLITIIAIRKPKIHDTT